MSPGDVWYALVAMNVVLYPTFVLRRQEAGLWSSLVLSVLLGPLVWFVWLARRAGVRRAAKDE